MSSSDIGLGRLGAWGHLDTLSMEEARDYARRIDELGYGTLWVAETASREPFALLAGLVDVTTSMKLGTSIASIWARDAQTARMAAMTLQEASAGRFVLGLGVSHRHLAEKLRGHHYERPLTRMREYLAAYRSAKYRGPMPPEGAGDPPVLLAALRDRMTALAATDADGAFPYLVTPDHVAHMRAVLDGAVATADAPRASLAVTLPVSLAASASEARATARGYLASYLPTPNYQASWTLQGFDANDWEKPGSDRLVDAMVAWGTVESVRERIAEMLAAGADHIAIIPLNAEGRTEHLPTLEALAG
ncbi:MAG TPA: TIGR03620 family F420-dependent LLM class oxidoreductase [Candidatus Limnocylindria bacterium]|jgi:probable F420-dependent oxidoreductase|nr:TIGR03620 family F420-dependent LLM class oxidoreductase [Candidatus Limnocylindria bacterium]